MFHDLDATLGALLGRSPATEMAELRGAQVSFEAPDRGFTPGQPTVDLFLYEVRENRELRHPVPVVERHGDGYVRRRPAVRADCSYIVTAWGGGGVGDVRVAAEHRLFGQALTWLSRFPRIPAEALRGGLSNPEYPLPTMVAQLDPNQNAGDFWAAMGVPPRPAFQLLVTVELAMGAGLDGPLATTLDTAFLPGGDRSADVGGTVRDAGGRPVAGAWVLIEQLGTVEISDAEGRFRFTRLVPDRAYTLRARAIGRADAVRDVRVPSATGEYDVSFQ
ncbi:Pvc16 family protein [Sphaerisporangium rhizosphaerae]|uniref:Pvc16 family protein n=1 Tax=Sphaerisporangium rhizosphaerae TaxID=2269375 RepID=A0ABW2PG00_9ACTN